MLWLMACEAERPGAASMPSGGRAGDAAGHAAADSAGSADAAGAVANECGDVAMQYLAPNCTFPVCHDGQSSNPLDLLGPGLPGRLVGRASTSLKCSGLLYIDPAAPEQSLLLRKLDPNRPCGERMPPAAMATDAERACLLQWIRAAVAKP
jgi:hypothetical protein